MAGGSSATTRTEPWAEQKPYLTAGFKEAGDIYRAGPSAYYPKETLAGFDPLQIRAQKAAGEYITGPRAASQQAFAEKRLQTGLEGKVDTETFNPVMTALAEQMKSQLTGNILPGIRQSLVENQPGGSTRGDMIQSQAISSANQQMLNKAAEMYGGAYQGAQDRATQFAQLYPSIMGAPLGMYEALGDVGGQRRALQQEAINQDQLRYNYDAQKDKGMLENYMGMISGDYGGTSKETPSAISTVGQMASLAMMLGASDERLKENIEQVGVLNGFNIYHFNYLWSPKKFIGVIAQEVERIMPEAVEKINGYRIVNYGALFSWQLR